MIKPKSKTETQVGNCNFFREYGNAEWSGEVILSQSLKYVKMIEV